MNNAIIGLGSNIDPEENIKRAKKLLAKKYDIVDESDFVTTKPVGLTAQPDFLNGAVWIATPLSRTKLIASLKAIERALGRESRHDRFGPRTIDLDLLVWNGEVTDPDFYERPFVKNSVLQLLPELSH